MSQPETCAPVSHFIQTKYWTMSFNLRCKITVHYSNTLQSLSLDVNVLISVKRPCYWTISIKRNIYHYQCKSQHENITCLWNFKLKRSYFLCHLWHYTKRFQRAKQTPINHKRDTTQHQSVNLDVELQSELAVEASNTASINLPAAAVCPWLEWRWKLLLLSVQFSVLCLLTLSSDTETVSAANYSMQFA